MRTMLMGFNTLYDRERLGARLDPVRVVLLSFAPLPNHLL